MISDDAFRRASEELRREVEELLGSVGFLCRVFGRGKSRHSLTRKLNSTPGKYSVGGRLIQDPVGIRVVLYFSEDIEIVQEILGSRYQLDPDGTTVDVPSSTVFSVTRHNLVFKVPKKHERDMKIGSNGAPIDSTFEVQIRTILSEGWHEVEHDLRYKNPDHWDGQNDLNRSLNGVVATLETSEWTMRKILDDLAYRNYKQRAWSAMLHSTLRMRITPALSEKIRIAFDSDQQLAKEALRINRKDVFRNLSKLTPKIPVTIDNVIWMWNHFGSKNAVIAASAPDFLREQFEETKLA